MIRGVTHARHQVRTGSPDMVKADLRKRNDPEKIAWVDDLLAKDARSRELKVATDQLRQRRNTIARDINAAKKAGQDASALLAEAAALPQGIKDCDAEQEEIGVAIRSYLMRLPNILHESVPVGKDDTENVEIKNVGTPKTFHLRDQEPRAAGYREGMGRFRTGCQNIRRRVLFSQGKSGPP